MTHHEIDAFREEMFRYIITLFRFGQDNKSHQETLCRELSAICEVHAAACRQMTAWREKADDAGGEYLIRDALVQLRKVGPHSGADAHSLNQAVQCLAEYLGEADPFIPNESDRKDGGA